MMFGMQSPSLPVFSIPKIGIAIPDSDAMKTWKQSLASGILQMSLHYLTRVGRIKGTSCGVCDEMGDAFILFQTKVDKYYFTVSLNLHVICDIGQITSDAVPFMKKPGVIIVKIVNGEQVPRLLRVPIKTLLITIFLFITARQRLLSGKCHKLLARWAW